MVSKEAEFQVANGSNDDSVQPVKRRPGRPRKYPRPDEDDRTSNNNNATTAAAATTTTTSTRTAQGASSSSSYDAIALPAKRRPGRPRKSEQSASSGAGAPLPAPSPSSSSRNTRASRNVGTSNGVSAGNALRPSPRTHARAVEAEPEGESGSSSSDDDSQEVEDMLLGKTNPHNLQPSSAIPSSIDQQSQELLAAIQQDSAAFKVPQVGDTYGTSEEFKDHIRNFALRRSHRAIVHGQAQNHVVKMVCTNWKKPEYTPPSLGCTFGFRAQRPASNAAGIWTIVAAQPKHILTCQKKEQAARIAQQEQAARSSASPAKRSSQASSSAPAKRGPGRPRKNPL